MGLEDGGAFAAAPPPVGGLGNFKGVMLCNRPVDDPSKTAHGGEGDGLRPFNSTVSASHGEAIGLNPCKKMEGPSADQVKTRGSSAALRRHVRWLKELQGQMKEERGQVDDDEKMTVERKKKMAVFFEKQRDAVRQMKKKGEGMTADEVEQALKVKPKKSEGATNKKPLWAMTSTEKDEFEEEDAANLINFAENLDYDKFLGDLEFKECLVALNDRAGKLKKEQDKFKDSLVAEFNQDEDDEDRSTSAGGTELDDGIDGQSLLPSEGGGSQGHAKRTRGAERYDKEGKLEWDSSTNAGDDRPQMDPETRSAAERVLESNSQIRAVHSQASVQKMIEKAKAEQQMAANVLISNMRSDEPPLAPVIVQSGDVENRLNKPIDPSTLPYLYRSPAV